MLQQTTHTIHALSGSQHKILHQRTTRLKIILIQKYVHCHKHN